MDHCWKHKNVAESQNAETMTNALMKRFFYLPYGEHELLYSLSDPPTHEDKITEEDRRKEEERLKENNLPRRGIHATRKRGFFYGGSEALETVTEMKEKARDLVLSHPEGFKISESNLERVRLSKKISDSQKKGSERKLSRRGSNAIRKRYYSWNITKGELRGKMDAHPERWGWVNRDGGGQRGSSMPEESDGRITEKV